MENLFIFTDGGSRGNPGPAAIGVEIKTEKGQILARLSRKVGITTNNLAEYSAVIAALEWLRDNPRSPINAGRQSANNPIIRFFLDSALVVNQLNGIFKVKDGDLRVKIVDIRQLEQAIRGNVIYNLIPREKNRQADELVNRALDGKTRNPNVEIRNKFQYSKF